MSASVDATGPERIERINFDDVLARIERQQAETRKFVAEREKLMAEREKLSAEALKLGRDRQLAPLVLLASAGGGAIVALLSWALNHLPPLQPHGG